jgi:hypothetical protein
MGFRHPVRRWNGSDDVNIRWKAEQPGARAWRRQPGDWVAVRRR